MKKLLIIASTLLVSASVLSGSLLAADARSALSSLKAGRYMIKFKDFSQRHRSALTAPGNNVYLEIPSVNIVAAELTADAVHLLANDPEVELESDENLRYTQAQTVPYGIPMVQADQVSDEFASNRKVCVIDSGYRLGHPDLQSARVTGEGIPGSLSPWEDLCEHGTHVTGTIAALNNDEGVIGVLPSARVNLHIVRVFDRPDAAGNCSVNPSYVIAAVQACRAAGANVINMSLGGSGQSAFERQVFDAAYRAGVLPVAAAGNCPSPYTTCTQCRYPACYESVVSVAALNENKDRGLFSHFNADVELAAPGLRVLSTVVTTSVGTTTVDDVTYGDGYIVDAFSGTATAELTDGASVGDALCAETHPEWKGKVVLCERGGGIPFSTKVLNVQNSGGVGAIIFNNVAETVECGSFTHGGVATMIPSVKVKLEEGEFLRDNKLGFPATVVSTRDLDTPNYKTNCGTSMASPHVAGVAALVWSYNPNWSVEQIRDALSVTAEDLGEPGHDPSYGFGLVQARAALDYLLGRGPGGGGAPGKRGKVPTSSFGGLTTTTSVQAACAPVPQ